MHFLPASSPTWRELKWLARDRASHVLARLNRTRLAETTFIGITGSAGKSTTKYLVTAILAARSECSSSARTGNEHNVVDAAVLSTRRRHRYCVVEMGAPEPGYLDRSIKALRPDIGVLTLVAREHYSAYKSAEAIAVEKGKLIEALQVDGAAVLNLDDPLVRAVGERCRAPVIWVGSHEGATLRLLKATSQWPEPLRLEIEHEGKIHEVTTRLHGKYLALPVLCALGVAIAARIDLHEAIETLALVEPVAGRMQIEHCDDGVVFLRDDWKAPQWSFEAPLEFMRDARAQRKIVVIGSISDSVKSPTKRYQYAARKALEVADMVVLVGPNALSAGKVYAGEKDQALHAFASVREAAAFLATELHHGDLVLLKGTNKQDHLVRILLDRRAPVQCWQPACGRSRFCTSCSKLYDPGMAEAMQPAAGLSQATDPSSGLQASLATGRTECPVIVGLGNSGEQYGNSAHNVGFAALDAIADASGAPWIREPEGMSSKVVVDGVRLVLLKPATNMNSSGPAIRKFLDRVGCGPGNCVIVHDDSDLDIGICRIKNKGGHGGHKGVASTIASLETDAVRRVRIGVRRPGDARGARALVLERFSGGDQAALSEGLARAQASILSAARELAVEKTGVRTYEQ